MEHPHLRVASELKQRIIELEKEKHLTLAARDKLLDILQHCQNEGWLDSDFGAWFDAALSQYADPAVKDPSTKKLPSAATLPTFDRSGLLESLVSLASEGNDLSGDSKLTV